MLRKPRRHSQRLPEESRYAWGGTSTAAHAWPANDGVTGVQTCQVNHDGVVYQKDLGPETSKIAPPIKRYNPDKTWLVTEDEL